MKRGDIVEIGPHRLMCGDSRQHEDVCRLFSGREADILVTSPPYLHQRRYGDGKNTAMCWLTMMQEFMAAAPMKSDAPIFVVLGNIFKNNEWQPYAFDWVREQSGKSWKLHGLYVWDKGNGVIGKFGSRLRPRYEWIFHWMRAARPPKKTIRSKVIGQRFSGFDINNKAGASNAGRLTWHGKEYPHYRTADDILHHHRDRSRGLLHPARFPCSLVSDLANIYGNDNGIIYDPFAGSGTCFLAADALGRPAYGMEIEPSYCEEAVERILKHMEKKR